MKKGTIIASLIPLCLAHLVSIHVSAQTAAEWGQDIDLLTKKIEQYHPLPWAKISRDAFMGKAEEIKSDLKTWEKERIILEVRRLVASLRDGHTEVLILNRDHFNLWFPVRIEKFHDGLFIAGADIKNAELLGAKVLGMGKLDAASAYNLVGTAISSDSDHGIARLAPNYLSNAFVLKALGIIDSETLLPLDVLLLNGREKKISVESARWGQVLPLHFFKTRVPTNNEAKTIFDDKLESLPRYLSKVIPSRIPYWFEYIPDDKMMYLQYNNVADWSKDPFRDFTAKLFKTFDEHIAEIDKFIIDVRFNSGGNGYLLPPFVREFILRGSSFSRVKLYIITGKDTFSAASNFIGKMLKNTNALTVGDIAAGPLNWCSDTIGFLLPNSRLMVSISTMFWQEGSATDNRGYCPPDCYIPLTFKDYSSGSDPVLDAIKNNEVKSLKDILFQEGSKKFRSEFRRREEAYGPAKGWFPYTSFDIGQFAYYTLFSAGKVDEAGEIFRLNTVLHPEDIRAWYFLAALHEQRGELKEAQECYEKLISIEPYVPEARESYHNLVLRRTFAEQGIDALARTFNELKKSHPSEINEGTLNILGYSLIGNKRIQDAVEIFKLNVKIHPDYANGYDSLGEAYLGMGEKDLAIKAYKKALELDPGLRSSKEALEKLKEK
jgi:tetratricopeptide (TPR) repeat protein